MEELRTELMDTVLRLGNGGLGGLKDSEKFELKLTKTTKLADFVPLIISVQVRPECSLSFLFISVIFQFFTCKLIFSNLNNVGERAG